MKEYLYTDESNRYDNIIKSLDRYYEAVDFCNYDDRPFIVSFHMTVCMISILRNLMPGELLSDFQGETQHYIDDINPILNFNYGKHPLPTY